MTISNSVKLYRSKTINKERQQKYMIQYAIKNKEKLKEKWMAHGRPARNSRYALHTELKLFRNILIDNI